MHLIAELGADPAEVPRARHLLSARLQEWDLEPDAVDTALLLLSELVTNAVRHGRPPVHVLAGLRGPGTFRVEVDDADPAPVHQRSPGADDIGGRGLQLVDMLSSAWGSVTVPDHHGEHAAVAGKRVWFELGAQDALTA